MAERRAVLGTLSLTARVALGVLSILLIGIGIVSVAAFTYGREAAEEAYDRLLLGAANNIASAVSVQDGRLAVTLPVSAFQLLALAPEDRIGYRVIGVRGETLTGYGEISLPEARGRRGTPDYFDADFFGEPARFAVVSRRFAERTLNGTVNVIVGHTLRARNDLALDITRKALYVVAATGAAMMLLAAVVVRSALKPLERIAAELSRRDPHDLTPMNTRLPKDIAVMVEAANRFMHRLDRQMGSMRHLISDAAHQLRTPVAALRAQADLLAGEEDEGRRARIVERIHTRSVRLGRLLDQLLARALVVHRGESARRQWLDLRDVALDVCEEDDHSVLAPQSEVRLDLPPDPVPVLADPPSVHEALKNLLNNALTHGRAPVTVGAGMEDGKAVLWVRDCGNGPAPEILRGAGTRFNTPEGRMREGSSGLGLAIAHSVADAFGGRLVMEKDAGDGFRAVLVFDPAGEARS
ncbi:sensor histidine kinase [Roseibium aestuarii]|uniref:histidine kinase n=1 Tax=Roseibium aestuarii TaxID=2600299 RepID=A0ABW4JYD3_9HYPH|nr:sensor histidine kinase [Roseibium aestuarii]